MTKEVKEVKKKVVKRVSYETLKALFYSGKVKPSLNKVLVELENDPENLDLIHLGCQCLVRTKNFKDLLEYAELSLSLVPENPNGLYFRGVAFQHTKGKEQEALKNFNQALEIDPENTLYLKNKGATHFLLFTDYDLPIKFAEKHRAKAEESLMKILELIEQKDSPTFMDYFTTGEVSVMVSKSLDAKKYFIKAVTAFENTAPEDQNMNIYKDIIKAQKACIKLMEKFTE